MTTNIIFKIDKKLKDAAQKRARQEGIALSDLYQLTTRSFVKGDLSIGLVSKGEQLIPNNRTTRLLREARKDIRMGKGLSPRFKDAKTAISYLRSI